jgi:hypothetical protein
MSVLQNDHELIEHIKKLKFVDLPLLEPQLDLIRYFVTAYQDTDQDTVEFAAEAFVVIRSILAGQRPVKLIYLTDFEGEKKQEGGPP